MIRNYIQMYAGIKKILMMLGNKFKDAAVI